MQDPLAQLLGGGGTSAAPAAAAALAASSQPHQMVVFDQDGLRITFDVFATPGGAPGAVTVASAATNNGLDDIADFNLQAGLGVGGWCCWRWHMKTLIQAVKSVCVCVCKGRV